ncbi:MAG TPA: endopeptidase La [Gammaproteobacteria bacterium]|nr:endopeptidase La [Gammaproteobacteria bacterium]
MTEQNIKTAAVLPLRDVVVFPGMVVPLFVGRPKSIKALESAMKNSLPIILVAQKNAETDNPKIADVFTTGTLSTILQMVKLQDGTHKVLIEGSQRVQLLQLQDNEYFRAEYQQASIEKSHEDSEINALVRSLKDNFERYAKQNKKTPKELLNSIVSIEDAEKLTDTISAHLNIQISEKQKLLEQLNIGLRLESLLTVVDTELEMIKMEKKIRGRVKTQIEKNQREYYLNEQIKAIQKELNDIDETNSEHGELEKKIAETKLSKQAREKVISELKKLKLMPAMSTEATVVRNYLDTILNLPWNERNEIKTDIGFAKKVLDEDHYGLEEVKERILEFLAVQKRKKKMKGPIMCLVGPPGVGKTSLGKSIAKATSRTYCRMSLGGIRDEAEIRGHRRTYIGSMPGRIIQNINKAKTCNPLMLLDELDKMSADFRGDPASALLEVLDPEQNHAFADHYLDIDFDLSEVMFIATANTLNIPGPLRDRMEIIRIPGYTEQEKIEIAMRYLIPKQIEANGLEKKELSISRAAVKEIIRYYTKESGVRNLEREISKACRKVVKQILTDNDVSKISITIKNIEQYLGVRKTNFGRAYVNNEVGMVTGLAWTEVGGELLHIESTILTGNGKQTLTGHLGKVMKESIQTSFSMIKSRAQSLGIDISSLLKKDIHIHVPEGATPKDGPSAGVGMCVALVSALTNNPVNADVAMTGEITLRGKVLEIGGLKEKLLAALRGGIKKVIIPFDNAKDLIKMPTQVKNELEIIPVKYIDEVFDIALVDDLKPLSDEDYHIMMNVSEGLKKTTQETFSH